jgi:hypothetical protein
MIRGLLLISALLVGGAVAAQQSPKASADPLREICSGFLAQSGAGVSGDHARLCTCLVGETQKQLTRQEMELYNKAASSGQPPPAEIMQKVLGIAATCLTQSR